jgi:hypothetical protein
VALPRSTPGIGNRAWNSAGGAPQRFAPLKAGSRAPFGGYGQVPGVARPGLIGGGVGVSVFIDLKRLGRALGDVNLRNATGIHQAINKGVDRLFTVLKRDIVQWTGIPAGTVAAGMSKKRAYAGGLTGAVIVRGKHYKINGMFNAAWGGPSTAGGTHNAWRNPQTAKHSFMVGGTLKTRTTSKRFPIKSLWGPNPAREVIRHAGYVQGQMNTIMATLVVPEIVRGVDREFKRVKAKYGL